MKRSNRPYPTRLAACLLLSALQEGVHASEGGPYSLVKTLWGGAAAVGLSNGGTGLSGSAGESAAGHRHWRAPYELTSGYFSGFLGAGPGLRVLHTRVGTTSFYQDGLQVGVPLDGVLEVAFSDQLNPSTVQAGLRVVRILDHMGRRREDAVAVQTVYDPGGKTVLLSATAGWSGNTLYQIEVTPEMQSVDGFTSSGELPAAFVTAVDPGQENLVLLPIGRGLGGGPSQGAPGVPDGLELYIPVGALPEYSVVLFSRDPMNSPLHVSPAIIQEANRKAAAALDQYAVPVALREVHAYDLRGQRLAAPLRSMTFTVGYGDPAARLNGPVRTGSLSLWALDEAHRRWVRLPDSRVRPESRTVTSPVSRFSAFALMGAPFGNASDAHIFPNPWRPNGPAAGDEAGRSGSHAGGMTFSQLPSECRIRIYTLSGDLVRELKHSDLSGTLAQERWDGKNSRGDVVASGVYVWRVESAEDAKNGKLMIIR